MTRTQTLFAALGVFQVVLVATCEALQTRQRARHAASPLNQLNLTVQ